MHMFNSLNQHILTVNLGFRLNIGLVAMPRNVDYYFILVIILTRSLLQHSFW